jgi:enamine deaminase RidA (YjgF/YER057c/UK114 family)
MNAVWDEWVDQANPPARATCGAALARPGMRVEMVAVASLDD